MLASVRAKLSAIVIIAALGGIVFAFLSHKEQNRAPFVVQSEIRKQMRNIANPVVNISTTQGDLVIELYPEVAPQSVTAFKNWINTGLYEKRNFFSVVPNNYIMTGQLPGRETTNITLPLETSHFYNHKSKGVVGMYHPPRQRDGATNQFYISLSPLPDRDGNYTIIGQVRDGLDVLDKITTEDSVVTTQITK